MTFKPRHNDLDLNGDHGKEIIKINAILRGAHQGMQLSIRAFCSGGFFMNHEVYVCQKIREDGWQMNVEEVLERDASPSLGSWIRMEISSWFQVPFMKPLVFVACGRWL